MKIKLTKLDADLILNWYTLSNNSHYGAEEFVIGEEQLVIDKLLGVKESKELEFNMIELQVILVWAERNNGIYEEIKLVEKFKESYKKELLIFKEELMKY